MFGFSMGEILLLAVIALIVIGPKQLPEFARQIGKILNEVKRAASDFSHEIKEQARIDLDSEKDKKIATPAAEATKPPSAVSDYAKEIAIDGVSHGEATSSDKAPGKKDSAT